MNLKYQSRRAALLAILFICVLSFSLIAQAEQPSAVTVSHAEGAVGSTVSVTVSLSENTGLCSLHLTLSYDADALTLKSVEEKGLMGKWYQSSEALSAQPYEMLWISAEAVDATGELIVLTFEISEAAETGSYPIDVTLKGALDGDGNDVDLQITDGSVEVLCSHSFGEWTKVDNLQHRRVCTICGEDEAVAHNWRQTQVHANGACDENATVDLTCRDCGATKTEAYAASAAHSYGIWEDQKDGQHTRTCRVCGKTETGQHTWDSGQINAQQPCDENGTVTYTCTKCGLTRDEDYEPTGEHNWTNCITAGKDIHVYRCSVCNQIKEELHDWNEGTIDSDVPCDENAKITYRCELCNETKTTSYTPTAPHNYGAWTQIDAIKHTHTCTECGKTEDLAHEWAVVGMNIKDFCDEHGSVDYECTACGATKNEAYVPTEQHDYGAWTQNDALLHKRVCRACGKAEITEHAWDDGTVDILGDCDENGSVTYTCDDCGATRVEKFLPTASHQYGDYTKKDDYLHQHVCLECGKIETKEHVWSVSEEHILGACDENGTVDLQCEHCGATYTKSYVPTAAHTFSDWQKVDGETHKHVCSVCQKEEAAEHTWDQGKIHVEYCGGPGTIEYTCTGCGATYSENYVSDINHTYVYQKKDENTHTYECMICHNDSGTSAHQWDSGDVSSKGACDENGTVTYTCTDCGAKKTDPHTPTAQHSFGAWEKLDTDQHKRVCTVCEKSESAAHQWDSGDVSSNGACDENGTVTYTCTDCAAEKNTPYTPTAPHSFGAWEGVNAQNHRRTCSTCGREEIGAHSWSKGETHAIADCDENGYYLIFCVTCGSSQQQPIDTTQHTFGDWSYNATLNLMERVCKLCQKKETQNGSNLPPPPSGEVQILPGQELYFPAGTQLVAQKLTDAATADAIRSQLSAIDRSAIPLAVYDISLMMGDEKISAGGEITFAISLSEEEFKKFDSINVYYWSESGKLFACPTTVEDGTVQFTTLYDGHFVIVGTTAEQSNTWIWIVVIAVLSLGLVAAVVFFIVSKKRTGRPSPTPNNPAPSTKLAVNNPAPSAKPTVSDPAPSVKPTVNNPAPSAKPTVSDPTPSAKPTVSDPTPSAKPTVSDPTPPEKVPPIEPTPSPEIAPSDPAPPADMAEADDMAWFERVLEHSRNRSGESERSSVTDVDPSTEEEPITEAPIEEPSAASPDSSEDHTEDA